ncbi:MAG: hypothetical protein ACTS73_06070 [Arsenophonus sp. NEOnobi-MAG3]
MHKQSMETRMAWLAPYHEVEWSTKYRSGWLMSWGAGLTLVDCLLTDSSDYEQRYTGTGVFTFRPLIAKDIIDVELVVGAGGVQTANSSELVSLPAMLEFELLRWQVASLGNLNGQLAIVSSIEKLLAWEY